MAKNRKHKLDKFYTKDNIVNYCLSTINLNDYKTIIEPSAGNGAFSKKIPNCIALDIEPEDDSIIKQDFLLWNPTNLKRKILIIGNPPFGNQSSLLFKFFKKSIFADTIAFIVPKSFKKQSFQKRIPLNFHLKNEYDLPLDSFTLNEKNYNLPCIFQIWVKKDYNRTLPKKLEPVSFVFVKKNNNPDLSIRRVGVNAGKLFLHTNTSKSSHYFIKTNNIENFIEKWNNIKWEHNNTVGCNSISQQEIIQKIDFS